MKLINNKVKGFRKKCNLPAGIVDLLLRACWIGEELVLSWVKLV